jgi:hypothetical protein
LYSVPVSKAQLCVAQTGTTMNGMKNGRPDEMQISLVEGEVSDFIRNEITPARVIRVENAGEAEADKINFLLERAGRGSVKEIDRLIADLQRVRDYLVSEGDRVQRSITRYLEASQSTMASVKVIADSMSQWKGIDLSRGEHN